MENAILQNLEALLKPSYCSCPHAIFRMSSIRCVLEEIKALPKEEILKVYKHIREGYKQYEKIAYKEVIKELKSYLKKL